MTTKQDDHQTKPWALWIDLLGFGTRYLKDPWGSQGPGNDPVVHLKKLTESIFRVGTKLVTEDPECPWPNRIFARCMGYAYLISLDGPNSENLGFVVTVGIALLRDLAQAGAWATGAIASGDMRSTDLAWSKDFQHSMGKVSGYVMLSNGGNMTYPTFLGTALMKVNELKPPKGPMLVLSSEDAKGLAEHFERENCSKCVVAIDWIHHTSRDLGDIQESACLGWPSPAELEDDFRKYCMNLPPELCIKWRGNAESYLKVNPGA